MDEGMYVKNAAGEWVNVGKPDGFTVDAVWLTSPLVLIDPEAEVRRSTYVRPSDDELRNRIRREFGV